MCRLEFIVEHMLELGLNFEIVISSSWGKKQLLATLRKVRFKYPELIIGETGRRSLYRGDQIQEYVDSFDLKDYVVIDDEIDDICGGRCNVIDKSRVVESDMNEGMSNRNVMDILFLLVASDRYKK